MVSMVQDRIYPKLLIHINSFIKKDINTLYIRSERLILIKIKGFLPKLTHNLILTPNLYPNLNQMQN